MRKFRRTPRAKLPRRFLQPWYPVWCHGSPPVEAFMVLPALSWAALSWVAWRRLLPTGLRAAWPCTQCSGHCRRSGSRTLPTWPWSAQAMTSHQTSLRRSLLGVRCLVQRRHWRPCSAPPAKAWMATLPCWHAGSARPPEAHRPQLQRRWVSRARGPSVVCTLRPLAPPPDRLREQGLGAKLKPACARRKIEV